MKKITILLITCFMAISVYADYHPAVIYLWDGTQIECLMARPKVDAKTITYKISQKSKAQKIESSAIEKILIPDIEDDSYAEIVYIPYYKFYSTKMNNFRWLNLLIEGPVNLYQGMGYYLCKRENEIAATIITLFDTANMIGPSPLAKIGEKYFADYPELVQRLKNKEFKDRQVKEVVTEYNLWKSTNNAPNN